MRFSALPVAFLTLTSVVQCAAVEKRDLLQDLQDQAIAALQKAEDESTLEKRGSCTIFNAATRRDWNFMSAKERKSYISAVQCLIAAPSKSDPIAVPGARTRYDDFVGQHINQTQSIHGTGNFLSWHRYFVYGYEKALREECGYKGAQPYWNWLSYQDDLTKSPVFDGSDTSMSGDGNYVKHNGSIVASGNIWLPSGKGGGCLKDGPFKNLQYNLGPVRPTSDGLIPSDFPLAYNPRCASRDITSTAAIEWFTNTNLYNLTLGQASKSVYTFQNELQGRFGDKFLGMHAAGHATMGGEAGDFFSSTNDPVFFMHHAMLDRVWWIWQALHLNQAKTVAGTHTIFNNPPSANTTLEDLIETNYLNLPTVQIGDVLDTLEGEPLCYIYL